MLLARHCAGEQATRREAREPRRGGAAQQLQRRQQALLGVGEIAAERKRWNESLLAGRRERLLDPLRRVVAVFARQLEAPLDLAGILGAADELVLETGIR